VAYLLLCVCLKSQPDSDVAKMLADLIVVELLLFLAFLRLDNRSRRPSARRRLLFARGRSQSSSSRCTATSNWGSLGDFVKKKAHEFITAMIARADATAWQTVLHRLGTGSGVASAERLMMTASGANSQAAAFPVGKLADEEGQRAQL